MTPVPIGEYRDAMRGAICSACACFLEDKQNPGRCAHENSGQRSLFAHMPEVVDAISNNDSGSIEPYLVALRAEVCAHCDHQDGHGVCDLRDNRLPVPLWCPLDTYFNLIVGVVEDVQKLRA